MNMIFITGAYFYRTVWPIILKLSREVTLWQTMEMLILRY